MHQRVTLVMLITDSPNYHSVDTDHDVVADDCEGCESPGSGEQTVWSPRHQTQVSAAVVSGGCAEVAEETLWRLLSSLC